MKPLPAVRLIRGLQRAARRVAQVAMLLGLPLVPAAGGAAAAIDVDALWDHARPADTEARLRAALATAGGDDALVLRTQIARTYSLRERFDDAHRELDAIEPLLVRAGAEPRVRFLLERGRTLRSAGEPQRAQPLFGLAFETAQQAGLEALAVDAMHMVALVQPTPQAALPWHRRTIDHARAAQQPKARAWEASALHNLGVSLNELGRHDEALAAFRDALALRERHGKAPQIRVARWMVAHTLRRLGRIDDALAQQLALERELHAAGQSDAHVFDELALLHDAKGDAVGAARYRELKRDAGKR